MSRNSRKRSFGSITPVKWWDSSKYGMLVEDEFAEYAIAYNLLDVGIRHMSTSIMNSMCSGSIIWLAVLLIPCLFISVIIINGLTFSSYFIAPCGGNTSLISSLGKGMVVSFRNLSASVVVMISAIIFFLQL